MSRQAYRLQLESDSKALISHILNFKVSFVMLVKKFIFNISLITLWQEGEDDKNISRSLDFVMSNLLYHQFLDVNGHAVQRTFDGLLLKMNVHGLQRKAQALDKCLQSVKKCKLLNKKVGVKVLLSNILILAMNFLKFFFKL